MTEPTRKAIQATRHLNAMVMTDKKLYEQILSTTGFAYHFNELCLLAQKGDDWEKTAEKKSAGTTATRLDSDLYRLSQKELLDKAVRMEKEFQKKDRQRTETIYILLAMIAMMIIITQLGIFKLI